VERAKRAGLTHLVKFSGIGAHPAASFEDDQLKAGLLAAGQSDWQATALVELNTYARQGHASVVTDTITTTRSLWVDTRTKLGRPWAPNGRTRRTDRHGRSRRLAPHSGAGAGDNQGRC